MPHAPHTRASARPAPSCLLGSQTDGYVQAALDGAGLGAGLGGVGVGDWDGELPLTVTALAESTTKSTDSDALREQGRVT